MRRKGRRETDGGISGEGRPIKRDGERGNMKDRGILGGDVQSGEEELKLPRGGCEKALPVGFCPSDRNVGLCPLNMPPLCLVHLSFCL